MLFRGRPSGGTGTRRAPQAKQNRRSPPGAGPGPKQRPGREQKSGMQDAQAEGRIHGSMAETAATADDRVACDETTGDGPGQGSAGRAIRRIPVALRVSEAHEWTRGADCAPGRAGPRSVRDSAPSDDPEVAWLGAGGNRLLETRLRLRCRRTSIQGGHNPGTSPRRNLQNDLRPSVWDCASAPRHVTAYDAHIWCWFAAAGYPELNFKPTVSMSDRRACRLGEFLDKRVTVPCANVNADSGSMSSGVSAWRTQPAIRSCLRESTEGQNCFPILSTWSKSTSSLQPGNVR
jgi:hypothetical protein